MTCAPAGGPAGLRGEESAGPRAAHSIARPTSDSHPSQYVHCRPIQSSYLSPMGMSPHTRQVVYGKFRRTTRPCPSCPVCIPVMIPCGITSHGTPRST